MYSVLRYFLKLDNFLKITYDILDILLRQKERQKEVKQQCMNFGLQADIEPIAKLRLDGIDFVVDDTHKILLKSVQKTGCTSWRTLFINNAPGNEGTFSTFEKSKYHTIGLGLLKEYSKEEALYRVRNYFSILTVRHPLRRLESWFMNNYMGHFHKKMGNITVSKEEVLAKFEKLFMDYLSGKELNRHWYTIYTQSYACRVNYRYDFLCCCIIKCVY